MGHFVLINLIGKDCQLHKCLHNFNQGWSRASVYCIYYTRWCTRMHTLCRYMLMNCGKAPPPNPTRSTRAGSKPLQSSRRNMLGRNTNEAIKPHWYPLDKDEWSSLPMDLDFFFLADLLSNEIHVTNTTGRNSVSSKPRTGHLLCLK